MIFCMCVCACVCVWYFLLEGEQSLEKPSDDSSCCGACNKNHGCYEPTERTVGTLLCVKSNMLIEASEEVLFNRSYQMFMGAV